MLVLVAAACDTGTPATPSPATGPTGVATALATSTAGATVPPVVANPTAATPATTTTQPTPVLAPPTATLTATASAQATDAIPAPTSQPTRAASPTAAPLPPSPTVSAAAPLTATVDKGGLAFPADGHILGELRGGRGPAGACSADALRRWSGPAFELALQKDVTLNGQPSRLILLGAPLLNDQGTPVVTGAADYGDVRWLVVGPECAASGAFILPPRNAGNEWPPQVMVARLHGTDRDQIVITSGAGAHWPRVNVFGYDARYGAWRNEGEFDGDGGADVGAPPLPGSPQGDLAWQAQREYDRSQLLQLQIFAWNPATMLYRLAETHIDFNFGPPATPTTPEEVVLLYYQAITAKDYRRAYGYLTSHMQQQQPFAQFQAGFATTTRVWVSDLQPIVADPGAGKPAGGSYPVTVQIVGEDRAADGALRQGGFAGTWTVLIQNGVPRLDAASIHPR